MYFFETLTIVIFSIVGGLVIIYMSLINSKEHALFNLSLDSTNKLEEISNLDENIYLMVEQVKDAKNYYYREKGASNETKVRIQGSNLMIIYLEDENETPYVQKYIKDYYESLLIPKEPYYKFYIHKRQFKEKPILYKH